jgi:hypothetical protein
VEWQCRNDTSERVAKHLELLQVCQASQCRWDHTDKFVGVQTQCGQSRKVGEGRWDSARKLIVSQIQACYGSEFPKCCRNRSGQCVLIQCKQIQCRKTAELGWDGAANYVLVQLEKFQRRERPQRSGDCSSQLVYSQVELRHSRES